MRTEAINTTLGSEFERSRIQSGVITATTEREFRARLLGISGSIASSMETPLRRVMMFGKSFSELDLTKVKKETTFSPTRRSRSLRERDRRHRRSGRSRCNPSSKHERQSCPRGGESRCRQPKEKLQTSNGSQSTRSNERSNLIRTSQIRHKSKDQFPGHNEKRPTRNKSFRGSKT